MKNLDHLFRIALLSLLVVGLIVATWHLTWLHKQTPEYRYEALAAGAGARAILVLDRQQGIVYSGEVEGGERSIVWHVSPLPKQ